MPTAVGTKSISGFDPRTVAKCCLWLDSSDSNTLFSDAAGTTASTLNGNVAFWKDKSIANANVSNATTAQQPVYTTAGVSYASSSNSGKGLFGVPPVLSSGGLAAFVVFNPTSLSTGSGRKSMVRLYTPGGYLVSLENWYIDMTTPTGYAYQYVIPIVGSNNLMTCIAYSSPSTFGWDLNFESSSTSWLSKVDGTNFGNELGIGSRSGLGFTFDGTISEVIIYDSYLTITQKQVIQRYLAQKWNVTTQRFNPTSISGCVLWNDASTLTGTGAVGTWSNLAGSEYTIACTGTKTANGRNGLNTVRLTTTQTWIPSPDVALGSHTLFWSGRQTGGTNRRVLQGTVNNHLYGYHGGSKRCVYNNAIPNFLGTTPSDREWDIFSYSRTAEGPYIFSWNGNVILSGATSTGSWMDGLRINSGQHGTGTTFDESSDCEVGEIILFNRYLVENNDYDERRMIERYLDNKWNKALQFPNNFPLDTVSPRLRAFQPTDFRDCYFWIDAAQDRTTLGTTVSTLPDWSGNTAPSIAPFDGTITLQSNGLNGLPVYNFGTSRALSGPTFVWNASFTQFVVLQCTAGGWTAANLVPANNTYYNYVNSYNWALYYDTVMQVNDSLLVPNIANSHVLDYATGGRTSWQIFCLGHRSGDSNLTNYTINGTVLSSTSHVASSITNIGKLVLSGSGSGSSGTTKVAEFIHYNRSLSQAERQQVEGYLAHKWGLTESLGFSIMPTLLRDCSLWLDGADKSSASMTFSSGSNLSVWKDKSGNNRHFNFTSGTPTSVVDSNLNVVSFPTGSNTVMTSSSNVTLANTSSVFIVCKLTKAAGFAMVLGFPSMFGTGDYSIRFSGGILTGTQANVGNVNDIGNTVYYVNGTFNPNFSSNVYMNRYVVISSLTFNNTGTTTISVSSSAYGRYFEGNIAEVLLYLGGVTLNQRTQIENYLMEKWNVTPFTINTPDGVTPFVPTIFSGCKVWLDAADASTITFSTGSNVSRWSDKSGNGYNAEVISSSPTYSSLNEAVYFSGTSGLYITSSSYNFYTNVNRIQSAFYVVSLASASAVSVVQGTSQDKGRILRSYNNQLETMEQNTVVNFSSGTTVANQRMILGYIDDGTTITHSINNLIYSQVVTTGALDFPSSGVRLGISQSGESMTGYIYEAMIFDTTLTPNQRQQIINYLSQKWNIYQTTSTFVPTSIAGCSTWLDAADATTTTQLSSGIWADKSGRGGNTTSNVGGGAFTIGSIRGDPAIQFPTTAGTAAFLIPDNASLTTSTGLSLFVAINPTGNAISGTRILSANNGGLQLTTHTASNPSTLTIYTSEGNIGGASTVTYSANIPFIYSATIKTNLVQQWSNGILGGMISTATSLTISNIYIGNYSTAGAGYAVLGQIGEIIIYSNVVTTTQRQQIENYLMEKWNIASSSIRVYHPFRTIRPNLVDSFTPASLSRCQLWLDGLDPAGTRVIPSAGSTVTTWIDKSGNANHGTANGTPTYVSNGGINFDGSSCFSNTAFKMTFANRSMFFVMQETTRTNNNGIFVLIPTSANHDYEVVSGLVYDTISGFDTYWNYGEYVYQMGNSTLLPRGIYNDNMNTVVGSGYVNGSNLTNRTAPNSATTCSGYVVAGRYIHPNITNRLNGVIYEIIAYDRGLTNSERQQVEGYLAWKWNLNNSLPTNHPFFKVSPPPAIRSNMLTKDQLHLWLDASDLSTLYQTASIATPVTATGQNVRLWMDKSGNQRHYNNVSTTSTFPLYSTKSQVPEIEFSAHGKVLVNSTNSSFTPLIRGIDVFVVTQPSTSNTAHVLFSTGYNDYHTWLPGSSTALSTYYGSNSIQYGSLTLDGSRRVIIHLSNSTAGIQSASITPLGEAYDGNSVMSAASGSNSASGTFYMIGGGWLGSWTSPWGNISEILMFRKNLGNQEKIEVFNYLNSKWFTRVTLSNAIDYLPLVSNATNLGTTPQTVTTVGGVTYVTVGGYPCAYFDNSFGMYLQIGFTRPVKFTVCFWLRPFAVPSTLWTAISISEATLTSPAMQVDLLFSQTQITVYTAMPNQWSLSTTGASTVATWTHYAITVNQTTFVQQLYVNGVLASTGTGTGGLLSRDRWILGRSGDGGRAYQGYIRQFAVFNTILTPYEVRDIYLATS